MRFIEKAQHLLLWPDFCYSHDVYSLIFYVVKSFTVTW